MKKIAILIFMLFALSTVAQKRMFDTIGFIRGGTLYKILLYNDSLQINAKKYYSFPGWQMMPAASEALWTRVTGTTSNIYNINSGNVGIGTSTPTNTLNVVGGLSVNKTNGIAGYFYSSNGGYAVNGAAGGSSYGDILQQIQALEFTLHQLVVISSISETIKNSIKDSVMVMTAAGDVGIGTSNPTSKLQVITVGNAIAGESTTGVGVVGQSTSSAGVWGISSSSTALFGTSTSGYGVKGISASNYGVYGVCEGSNAGVYGISSSGTGGYFSSTSGNGIYGSGYYGVYATSNRNNYAAVYGSTSNELTIPIYANNSHIGTGVVGVYSYTYYGKAIKGVTQAGYGLYGETIDGNGYAVYGKSPTGIAIYGTTTSGLAGVFMGGNVGIGTTSPSSQLSVYSSYQQAIYAKGVNNHSIYSESPSATYSAVYGANTSSGTGILGSSNSGTGGSFSSASGTGLYAASVSGNQFYFGNDVNSTKDSVMVMTAGGYVGLGTTSPTCMFDLNSDIIRVRSSKTPTSASATGNAGDICWDADYIYICTATNTWKRVAITTW